MTCEFYRPSLAEHAKVFALKQTLSLINEVIAAASENHETFGDMLYSTDNETRWDLIGCLRPIAELYDRLNHTSADPATGLNKVKGEATNHERSIMAQITPKSLKREAIEGEKAIIQELRDRLAQIKLKQQRAWPEFPAELIAHCKALLQEGSRVAALPLMPTEDEPLRSFNSVKEWQASLTEDTEQGNGDTIA